MMTINNILNFFRAGSYHPSFFAVKNSNDDSTAELLDFHSLNFPSKKTLLFTMDNKEQFKKLFQIHHRRIFKLCLHVTRNYEDAEDITIEVFAQLYKELVCKELEDWDVSI